MRRSPRWRFWRLLPALLAATLACASELQTWRLQDGRFEGGGDGPMAVGSLQKPFVAKAWAESHPGLVPPRFTCPRGPGCWVRSGHGELDLVGALAVSCNAYFRSLATATPMGRLRATFAEEGFTGAPASPDSAIGLHDGESPPVIRPSKLLEAYVRLVDRPWISGEEIRQQVLAGLREAAWSGTAGRIGAQGCWAKTGTIPLDSLRTCGLALIVDASRRAVLGRLEPGSGREAVERLAAALRETASAADPPQVSTDQVRVRILELLRGRRIQLRNAGLAPIPAAQGFVGSGAKVDLAEGLWAGPGLLELLELRSGLIRRVRGRIECRRGPDGRLAVVLSTPLRDYVGGVIAAELPTQADSRRVELGAAILRFLALGPRHPDADVCDSTHCAWFVGLGPHPSWPQPDLSRMPSGVDETPPIEPREWEEMRARSRRPGHSQWTSHCGGRPLSPHVLWGQGDTAAPPCPRHHAGQSRPWRRTWSRSEAEKAFGGPVESLAVVHDSGKWMLRLSGPAGTRQLDYDEAHRRIARILGWGALPSPADDVFPGPDGFHLRGLGLGHRVGLCLGD